MLAALFDLLFPPREDEAIVRALSEVEIAGLVFPQPVPGTNPETVALLPFRDARVRALIHEAKYHGNEKAFDMLGNLLGEYLLELGAEESFGNTVIVPVPLSKERRRKRGFNQAEEMARRGAIHAGLSLVSDGLARTRDTGTQTSLSREARRENLQGAFNASETLDSSFTYILIDDVITTGATLQAAIDSLRLGGVKQVIAIALAH